MMQSDGGCLLGLGLNRMQRPDIACHQIEATLRYQDLIVYRALVRNGYKLCPLVSFEATETSASQENVPRCPALISVWAMLSPVPAAMPESTDDV